MTVKQAQTSVSTVLIDSAGERLVVPFNDPQLQYLNLADADLTLGEHVAACLVDVRWPDGAAQLLEQANQRGVLGMIDADVAEKAILHT